MPGSVRRPIFGKSSKSEGCPPPPRGFRIFRPSGNGIPPVKGGCCERVKSIGTFGTVFAGLNLQTRTPCLGGFVSGDTFHFTRHCFTWDYIYENTLSIVE